MVEDYEEGKQVVRVDNFGVVINLLKEIAKSNEAILSVQRYSEDKLKKIIELLESKQ